MKHWRILAVIAGLWLIMTGLDDYFDRDSSQNGAPSGAERE